MGILGIQYMGHGGWTLERMGIRLADWNWPQLDAQRRRRSGAGAGWCHWWVCGVWCFGFGPYGEVTVYLLRLGSWPGRG
jgi:hypothetical protein